ncbi:MAG: 1,2-phenylacetyl-CoA epoxidase subunit PaaB [Bacteroidia bacterium]
MSITSLDPRFQRIEKALEETPAYTLQPLENWVSYEVFVQRKRGDQHQHVGIVHAPDPEIALTLAKEQYARRSKCVNIWVVPTEAIYKSSYEDADMFEPAVDKSYREAHAYRPRKRLQNFLKSS